MKAVIRDHKIGDFQYLDRSERKSGSGMVYFGAKYDRQWGSRYEIRFQ